MMCPLHQVAYSTDGICAQCLAAAFTQQRELMNALEAHIKDLRTQCQDLRAENVRIRQRLLELEKRP